MYRQYRTRRDVFAEEKYSAQKKFMKEQKELMTEIYRDTKANTEYNRNFDQRLYLLYKQLENKFNDLKKLILLINCSSVILVLALTGFCILFNIIHNYG